MNMRKPAELVPWVLVSAAFLLILAVIVWGLFAGR